MSMSAGRPLNFDPERALEAATSAFWASGYEACSLQDLLSATRLSKSSLYLQFGNKQQLFERCIAHYTGQMEEVLQQLLLHAPTGKAFIQTMLIQVISESRPAKGCLIFNTASEFGQSKPELADQVRSSLQRFRCVFLQALQQDRDAGLIAIETDIEGLADYLMTAIGGLRTMVKLGMDSRSLKTTVSIILESLD